VVESGPSTGGRDSLDAFVAALRGPLDFLARASAATAGRTHLPAQALAARARLLQAQVEQPWQRELLEALGHALERYEETGLTERTELIQHCRMLVEGLSRPSAPPAPYRGTTGDPAVALQQLGRSVQYLPGVGPRRAEEFRKFGISTIEDLLYHLPFRYEDRRRVRKIGDLQVGEEASVIGELTHLSERTVGRAQRRILEGVLRDETGLLGLTWYHQMAYFRHRYRIGQRLLVHGKIERLPGQSKRIVHPEIDAQPDESGQGVLPVYNKPTTMTVGAMRKLVQQAVRTFAELVPSALPPWTAQTAGVAELGTALAQVHLPAPEANIQELNNFTSIGHRSLVFDELFFLQLGMALRRRAVIREMGRSLPRLGHLSDRLLQSLPFRLTAAQQRVLREIYADMAQPHPMHRLVQGDVGSGKTIVALFGALVAIENGYQAAFMAPTELLAEQHFSTIRPFAESLGVRTVRLTGECARQERARILSQLAAGEVQLVVGTHALIQEDVCFHKLGLGVIDEQHRFGVLQRAALRRLGNGGGAVTPDILLMTATPIPRTLAMTVYGDLDVSILDELPPGRQLGRTLVFTESERQRVYELVKRELDRGRQGYVVYPLVESSEKEDLRDATTMQRELAATVFPGYRVGLVHGRMKASDKDAVMQRFRDRDVHLLVSTTVIEVGVDVPNATIMVVEHAERFGLSQLHQLRGRVGRGADRPTCILIAPYPRGDAAYRRLQTMAETNDGFRIAEVDLELRGPGEFLGTRQSGLPDFRVANLIRDTRILAQARQLAEACVARDPALSLPESAGLRAVLRHRWAGRLGLAEIG